MKLACLLLLISLAEDPTRPSLVVLKFRDQPLAEVVRSIGDQSGTSIGMAFAGLSEENVRKVTLEADEPVPFWNAVDRLCDVARLRSQINETGGAGVGSWNVSLFGPEPVDPQLNVYSGPFRFGHFSLHLDSVRDFTRDGDLRKGPTSERHFAEFEVLTEPRVIAIRTGPLVKLEATDDQGRSLINSGIPVEQRSPLVPGFENLGSFPQNLTVNLSTPKSPKGRLKSLRGVMPVVVGRIPREPARTLKLFGSVGHSISAGGFVLKVEAFDAKPGEQARLTINASPDADHAQQRPSTKTHLRGRLFALHRQIEILDDLGPLSASAGSQILEGESIRFEYTLSPRAPGAQTLPTLLRLYVPEWVSWEAPFEFGDVPLP